MFQISENADKLIRKMTQKNGFPAGGLRIGIKAGGCSGLSYVFAWEPAPEEGDHVFEGPDGVEGFRRPEELQIHRRDDARLRHQSRQQGLHVRQPERERHLRLRDVFQCVTRRPSAATTLAAPVQLAAIGSSGRVSSGISRQHHVHINRNDRRTRYARVQVRLCHRRREPTRFPRGSARMSSGSSRRRSRSPSGCSSGA